MDNNALARLQKLTRESPTVYAVEISCDGEATIDALWETRAAAEIHRDWHNSMKGNRRGFYGRARVVEMKICSEDVAREFYVRNAPAQETKPVSACEREGCNETRAIGGHFCPRHESLCEACARGDHANCGRQSWCDCDCEGAIDPGDDCIEFDPYEGTTEPDHEA